MRFPHLAVLRAPAHAATPLLRADYHPATTTNPPLTMQPKPPAYLGGFCCAKTYNGGTDYAPSEGTKMAMEDSPRPPKLSVIIPAYNEAHRLPESLRQLRVWLDDQPYSSEVIVVDDGSTDDTSKVVRAAMTEWAALSLHSASHAGKGAAVRDGARAARGELVT